jgi:hypothetical protein
MSVALLGNVGVINSLSLTITGNSDFDQFLVDSVKAGSITSTDNAAKMRLHTDGYHVSLASTFNADLTSASSTEYLNCVGQVSGDGAYCVRARIASTAGTEKLLELHWIAQSAIGTAAASSPPTTSVTTTGLLRFVSQLGTTFTQASTTTDDVIDYEYSDDSSFTAAWYQPKEADYYLNQMRFQADDAIMGWHYDSSTWTDGSSVTLTSDDGASYLALGATLGAIFALAF